LFDEKLSNINQEEEKDSINSAHVKPFMSTNEANYQSDHYFSVISLGLGHKPFSKKTNKHNSKSEGPVTVSLAGMK
jgi:hypothetical protein